MCAVVLRRGRGNGPSIRIHRKLKSRIERTDPLRKRLPVWIVCENNEQVIFRAGIKCKIITLKVDLEDEPLGSHSAGCWLSFAVRGEWEAEEALLNL